MKTSEFLLRLASDPELYAAFRRDPVKFLDERAEEYDLTAKQRALLTAGDLRLLRITIESDLHVEGEKSHFHTVWFSGTVWAPRPPCPPPCPPDGDPADAD